MTGGGTGPAEMRGRPAEARREHGVEGLAPTLARAVNLGARAGRCLAFQRHVRTPRGDYAQPSVRSTPLCQRAIPAARSASSIAGSQRRSARSIARSSSSPDQKPDREAGGIGGPERARLRDRRRDDGPAQDVRLELHQELVADHPAVHPQLRRGGPRPGRPPSRYRGRGPGRRSPRARPARCGARVAKRVSPAMMPRASLRQCGANNPENAGTNTTSPLSGTERASASTSAASSMMPRLSRSQPISAPATATEPSSAYVAGASPILAATVVIRPCVEWTGRAPGVHEHETAGPVRALDLPGLETGLAEERRVLVAEVARDRHAREVVDAGPVDLGRAADLGEHRGRHADGLEQLRVPVERLEVHQHRARGVRDVGHVDAAVGPAGQVPDEPRVDGPEEQVATGRGSSPFRAAVVEDPRELERRRVGRDRQPGPCPEPVRAVHPGRRQRLAGLRGPGVLPHDGVARPAGRSCGPRPRSSRAGC